MYYLKFICIKSFNVFLYHLFLHIHFNSLHHVCMSKCSIEVVPKKFLMSCKDTLITLDLANNQLSLPMNLVEHSALKTLELRFNKIKDVPVIHENLVQLGLFHNKITTIKELYPFLDQCDDLGKSKDGDWFRPNLRELHIGQNNLKKLDPQTMSVVTKLGLLDVTDNDLETFPPIVGYLRDLNKIVLDGNPFRMIRSAISYKPQGGIDTGKLLSSLRKKMVPPQGPGYHPDAGYVEPINGFDAATPQKVIEAKTLVRRAVEGQRTLNLDGRGNEGELVWPELIDALSCEKDDSTMGNKIAILNIADGKLTGFGTEWVNALPSLSEIDARRNCLVSLPSNLHQLPLKSIVCARNKLSSLILQDTICLIDTPLCSNLTDLDLSMNKLEWIPDGLFDLNTLRTLNLSKNNIKSLAWERDEQTGNERGWRHGLVSLEYLDLSNNRLHDLGYLPLALIGCQSLRTLLLNNNCIYDIPLEIGLLEQLLKIELLGNSQRKIATRTLTQSCSTILKYLRDRMDDSQITKARENHNEIFETLKEEYEIDIDKNYQKEDHVSVDKNNGIPPSNSIAEGKQSTPKPSTIVEAKQSTPKPSTVNSNKEASNSTLDIEGEQLLNQLEQQIEGFKKELMNLSLSKAKRFALKKSLAMHNSKLIRERRRLNEASS
jgi:Leucine-rich repeat (LRR) protein